jgi:hypothetical protein
MAFQDLFALQCHVAQVISNIIWCMSTGRFLQHYSADEILFGNTFDKPLKLPWGSGAALKFMQYV